MIELPAKFKQALGNGVRTSLYPIVRIYKDIQIDDPIEDATDIVNLSIKETNISGSAYKPLLLNTPSISSKADIINNKYTISSVSLSVSNVFYKGKIFSDDIPNLLNAVVQVYYAANGINELEDCLLVYTGTIRRYSQSAETLSLTLEDLTEQKLTTMIPSTIIPDEPTYLSDDVGKPFPMVYGHIDKSPIIVKTVVDELSNTGTEVISSLSYEKPEQRIKGAWELPLSEIYPTIENNNFLIQDNWLSNNNFLYVYNNGFAPINKKMPKEFSEWVTDSEGDEEINVSTQYEGLDVYNINLENESIDINKIVEGYIATRVIRPFTKSTFYARNKYDIEFESSWARYDSSNFIIGFTEHGTDIFDPRQMNRVFSNFGLNTSSVAKTAYENNWNNENQTWYEPTFINDMTTDNGSGEWGIVDYESGLKFNPTWLHKTDDNYGLHISSTNIAQGFANQGTGSMAKLIYDEIGSFKCVAKVHYRLSYYAPKGLGEYSYLGDFNTQKNVESVIYPSSIWFDPFLIDSGEQENTAQIDLQDMIDNAPQRYIPQPTDQVVEGIEAISGTTGASIKVQGHQNSSLTKDTNQFLNICWGADNHDSKYSSSSHYAARMCIASLHEMYLTNDIIIDSLTTQKFYASLKGRVNDNEDLIVNADKILYNILKNELNLNLEEEQSSFANDWFYGFTQNEQKEAKQIFEGLFKSSLLIPSFNSAGQFKFIGIKQLMDYTDVIPINIEDVIKYSFELTKLDDVYNSVNVKYKKNYGSGEYDKQTGYTIADTTYITLDEYTTIELGYSNNNAYDINYYGLDVEDAKLEVETEYIRDKSTAQKLQKRLLLWYANQHLITKIDLPLSYMHLEAGDYIQYNELLGGKLAFGYNYTTPEHRNGQFIYNVFFITKISKSLSKITIEAVQVHRGEYGFENLEPTPDNLNDTGNIVDGNGNNVTENNQLPDPNDNPNYNDDTTNNGDEEELEEELYLNTYWENNLNNFNNNSAINVNVTTNIEEDWNYDIYITRVDSSQGQITFPNESGIEPIQNGIYSEENAPSAMNIVNHNKSITEIEDNYNGTVLMSKKYSFIPENNDDYVIIEYIIKIYNNEKTNYLSFTQNNDEFVVFNNIYGDVNQDGGLNILDVVNIVQSIVDITWENFPNDGEGRNIADMNNDGIVNILDVIIIVNEILE